MTYTQPFENVYSHYPLKKGKFQAQKTWNKLSDDGSLPNEDTLIKAIHLQVKERVFLKSQNRFCPPWKHFSTWLNCGCFDDECELQVQRVQPKKVNGNSIETIMRALNILTNISEAKFDEYCRAVNMNSNDKEAVLNKYNMAFRDDAVQHFTRGIG